MNSDTICSKDRNRLFVAHLLENLFVSLVGPPISNFNPTPYVKKWLMAPHRHAVCADDTRTEKATSSLDQQYKRIWKTLSNSKGTLFAVAHPGFGKGGGGGHNQRFGGLAPTCQRIFRVFTTKTLFLAYFLPKKDTPVPEVTIDNTCRCVLQYNLL